MAARRKPMTPFGLRKLKKELKHIREVQKPENVKAIEEAREHGDLSENAEYKYAKEQQAFISGRENELESLISLAEVIDPATLSGDRVVFGATVTLLNLDTDEETTYTLVGEVESDVSEGRISITSPIARGLIGRREGDDVTIETPNGTREFEILEVEFQPIDGWE